MITVDSGTDMTKEEYNMYIDYTSSEYKMLRLPLQYSEMKDEAVNITIE